MSDTWYYLEGSERIGPITLAQLQKLLATGKLQGHDLVWQPGMSGWAQLSTVPALAATGNHSEAITRATAAPFPEPVEELEEFEEVDSAKDPESSALRVLDDDEKVEKPPRHCEFSVAEKETRPRRKKKKKKQASPEMQLAAKQAGFILFLLAGFATLAGLFQLAAGVDDVPPNLRPLVLLEPFLFGAFFAGLGAWALFKPFWPTLVGLLVYFGYWVFLVLVVEPLFVLYGIIPRLLILGAFVKALERAKAASESENRISHW